MKTNDAEESIPPEVPAGFRVEHSADSLRIKIISRPAMWLNVFLILWLLAWTGFTIAVCYNYFSDNIQDDGEKNSLGDVLGFTFFWVAAALILLFLNFAKTEIQLYDDHYEQHIDLACFCYVTRVERDSISSMALERQEITDDNGKNCDSWTISITGETKRKMNLFGTLTSGYSIQRQTRTRIMTTSEKKEATWLTTLLSSWKKPEIHMTDRDAEQSLASKLPPLFLKMVSLLAATR